MKNFCFPFQKVFGILVWYTTRQEAVSVIVVFSQFIKPCISNDKFP